MATKSAAMSKGEATKLRIVQEAAAIFNRAGLAATSMSDLMASTGLEKGGLYRHFPSKDDLACAAFAHAFKTVDEFRFGALPEDAGPGVQVAAFIRHFAHQRSPLAGGCPLFNTAVEARAGYPKLKKQAAQALKTWQDKLTALIHAGQESGEIAATYTPEAFAAVIISSLEGALVLRSASGSDAALLSVESFLLESLTVRQA